MSIISSLYDNYVTEVAASMLFGLGYYLVKGIKKKNEVTKPNKIESDKVKVKLEGALEKWNYAKSVEDYNSLIKQTYSQMDPNEILNDILSKGLTPNIDTYNALLLNAYHNKNFNAAKILREEILNPMSSVNPNAYTLNISIKGLGLLYKGYTQLDQTKAFDEELKKITEQFQQRGVFLDTIAHNTILDCLAEQRRMEDCWTLFETMMQTKQSDSYTFTTIIKAIKSIPNLNSSWMDKAILVMNKAGNRLEESFCNALLDCCIKFDRISQAESLFNQMLIENQSRLKEYSYAIMIKAYSKTMQLEKALKVFALLKKNKAEKAGNFDEDDKFDTRSHLTFRTNLHQDNQLKDDSIYPTTVTYGSILNACVRCNNIGLAEELFNEMTCIGVKKNAFIFSTLINGYRKSQNYLKAINIFDNLIKSLEEDSLSKNENTEAFLDTMTLNKNLNSTNSTSRQFNVVIFNSILDCCIECEKFEKMAQIFEFMTKSQLIKNLNIVPDIITYCILIKGYAKTDMIDKVWSVYNNINNMVLDEVLYNTILDCFARNSDEISMRKIFADMRAKNIPMSVITYGVMIKLYTNLGDCEAANEVFEELMNKGIRPTVIIYQLLLRLYSKRKMPYKAVEVFRNMLLMKVKPDRLIYDSIIKICFNHFYLEECVDFLIHSVQDGIRLDEEVFDSIVDWIIQDVERNVFMRSQLIGNLELALKNAHFKLSNYIEEKIVMFKKNVENNYVNKNHNLNCDPRLRYDSKNNYNNYDKDSRSKKSFHNKYDNKYDNKFENNFDLASHFSKPTFYKNHNEVEYENNYDNRSYYSQFKLPRAKNYHKNGNTEFEIDLNTKNNILFEMEDITRDFEKLGNESRLGNSKYVNANDKKENEKFRYDHNNTSKISGKRYTQQNHISSSKNFKEKSIYDI
jgi:pentatricopeptide repeat protein